MKYILFIIFVYLNNPFGFSNPFTDSISRNVENQVPQWMSTAGSKGFLENKGQMRDNSGNPLPFVLFRTESPGLSLWITETGMVIQTSQLTKKSIDEKDLTALEKAEQKATSKKKTNKFLNWERIDIEFKGANIERSNIIKEEAGETDFNFFYGHCQDGIYGVKEYDKITIQDVYPGIDWVIYRKLNGEIKYDFIVHPGANYKDIKLLYRSKKPINLNEQGQLEFFTAQGNLHEDTPVSFYQGTTIQTQFQIEDQKNTAIYGDIGYETVVAFQLPQPKTAYLSDLIIDPQLVWSSFYGANNLDGPMAIDTDAAGNVFVSGYTGSTDFPTQNPASGAYFQGTFGSVGDAFILKFSNSGVQLWATYYGGNGNDRGWSIDVDVNGNVFVTGDTQSTNFPLLNPGSGAYYQATLAGQLNVFILKLDNSGVLLWATYFGGGDLDFGYSITTDLNGNVFLTGTTNSTNFPTLDPGSGTYFQGALIGGFNAFILKFNNAGSLLWSTYYGNLYEVGYSIHADNSGNLYLTGLTESTSFPVLNPGSNAFFQGTYAGGNQDLFILRFTNTGVRQWATYYGGSSDERGLSIVADATGNVFVAGHTSSGNFPVFDPGMGAYFQGTYAGVTDVFMLKFNSSGVRQWATYYGGSGDDVQSAYDNLTIDNCGNVYMSFSAGSTVLPFQTSCDIGFFDDTHGGQTDVFLVLFSNEGVQNWSSFIGGNGLDFRGALASDSDNNIFMTGEWCGTSINNATYPVVDQGGYYDPSFNGGLDDGYIVKFAPSSIDVTISIIQPDCSDPCSGSATVNVPATCVYNYLWSDGQTTQTATGLCEGDYTVAISREFCSDFDTVLVAGITSPTTVATPVFSPVSSICAGDNLASLPMTSNNGITGTWSPALSNTSTQTYTFTPEAGQCATTTTLTIIVNPNPVVVAISNSPVCEGNLVNLSASPVAGGVYTWSGPNGYSSTDQNPAIQQVTTANGGIYTVTVTANGCSSAPSSVQVDINPGVTVNVIPLNPTVNSGQTVELVASGATSYTWFPATGLSCSNCSNPIASPTTTTTYSVVGTNASGCTDTAAVTVFNEVVCAAIFVPTIFSPNEDGLNDFECVFGDCISTLTFTIYNRWGEVVFESDSIDKCWDGTFKGMKVNSDVFVYKLHAILNTGVVVQKSGNISVVK